MKENPNKEIDLILKLSQLMTKEKILIIGKSLNYIIKNLKNIFKKICKLQMNKNYFF